MSMGSKIRRIIRIIYTAALIKVLFPFTYFCASRRRVDESKLLIVEVNEKPLTDNFKLLYDKLNKDYNFYIHIHYLENTKPGRFAYIKRCLKLIRDAGTAKYILVSDATQTLSCYHMRPETRYIQVWHACGAFKKFGRSTQGLKWSKGNFEDKHFPVHTNYNHVCVSSADVVWAYEEAMGYKDKPGVVLPVGISRTDVYFDNDYIAAARAHVRELFPASQDKKIILYAPTFRGRPRFAASPDELDIGAFREALGDEYVLLVRHHYMVKNPPAIPAEYANFAMDGTKIFTVDECLCAADICITDYSSLIFEYSLFKKPLLFFAFDLDDYNDWRGFYYPYDEMTPGPVCQTNQEMIEYIRNIKSEFNPQTVSAFCRKFMGACDGHSTERIIKLLLEEE